MQEWPTCLTAKTTRALFFLRILGNLLMEVPVLG